MSYLTRMPIIFVIYFSEIEQFYRPAQKTVSKIKNLSRESTTIYITFSKQYISWCKQERGHRCRQTADRITDRQTFLRSDHFLKRSYIWSIQSRTFSQEITTKCFHRSIIKVNKKKHFIFIIFLQQSSSQIHHIFMTSYHFFDHQHLKNYCLLYI